MLHGFNSLASQATHVFPTTTLAPEGQALPLMLMAAGADTKCQQKEGPLSPSLVSA